MNAEVPTPPAHLLDIESTAPSTLRHILDLAENMRERPSDFEGACNGRLLVNLFYEPSTRTGVSFEIAALRLGLRVVDIAAADSSVKKGETLMDTFRTLQAMAPDVVVIRHPVIEVSIPESWMPASSLSMMSQFVTVFSLQSFPMRTPAPVELWI